MCLAIYKPKDSEVPCDEYLRNGFLNNSDGAGFAVVQGDTVRIEKGFMTLQGFLDAFHKYNFTKDSELFIHFRYGTCGGKGPELTHPFPISDNVPTMKQLSCTVHRALIHNGILGKGEKDISDTMVFIRDVIAPMKTLLQEDSVKKALAGMISNSKIAMFDKGNVTLLGNWLNHKGVYYSNSDYSDKAWAKSSYRKYFRQKAYSKGKTTCLYPHNYHGYDYDCETDDKLPTTSHSIPLTGELAMDRSEGELCCPFCGDHFMIDVMDDVKMIENLNLESYYCHDCDKYFFTFPQEPKCDRDTEGEVIHSANCDCEECEIAASNGYSDSAQEYIARFVEGEGETVTKESEEN